MTLILASILESGAVLAADSRIAHGPSGEPNQRDVADKLFPVRSCAVASFGTSPANTNIPELILSFDKGPPATPMQLANDIYEKISSLSDQGDFGMLVLGMAEGKPSLCEVKSKQGVVALNIEEGAPLSRGVAMSFGNVHFEGSMAELQAQFLSVFRQATQQNDAVGPPYDFATLSLDGSLNISSNDS